MTAQPHLVHIFPSFAPGGAQVRTAQIMNALGAAYRHTVLAINGDNSASCYLTPEVRVDYTPTAPSKTGPRFFARTLQSLQPDLVLTYNWGSIEAAMGALLSCRAKLIHAEDGFGPDEAAGQKFRRIATRALVLRGAFRLVAPSLRLVEIMRRVWRIPERTVEYIPNGVDVDHFRPAPPRPPGPRCVIGAVGQLRPEKAQSALIRICGKLAPQHAISLTIAGEGPERRALTELSQSFSPELPVTFAGHRPDVHAVYPGFDIFAMTSVTEQMPLAVLEAMACGLPVASTDVGDIRNMVSEENRPFIVTAESVYAERMAELIANPELRRKIGAANRERAVSVFSLRGMLDRYSALYRSALEPRLAV